MYEMHSLFILQGLTHRLSCLSSCTFSVSMQFSDTFLQFLFFDGLYTSMFEYIRLN